MNNVQFQPNGVSPAEMIVLGVLILLALVAGWAFYQKWSGRGKSDISGLHFRQRK